MGWNPLQNKLNHVPICHLSTRTQQNSPSRGQAPQLCRTNLWHLRTKSSGSSTFSSNRSSRPKPNSKDVSANNYPNSGNGIHLPLPRHVHRKRRTSSPKYRKNVSLSDQMLKNLCYNGARVLWIEQEAVEWRGLFSFTLFWFWILMQRAALSVDWAM